MWGLARRLGAGVILRIEDHDRQRCRPEYERALLEDLEWLGLAPDRGSFVEFRRGPTLYRQSDSAAAYEAALARLQQRDLVYACDCSRRDIEESHAGGDAPPAGIEVPYSGRCRERGLLPGPGRGLRLRIEPGGERFDDLLLGEQSQDPARQCGDLLLRDRLGNWTYQFAVVVDDLRHDIDLVIRGRDLLSSTGRQLRLGRLLGREGPPRFAHHPLIYRPDGSKLSKAKQDTALRDLRAAGATPEELLGRAAHLVGLRAASGGLPVAELAGVFSATHS